MYSFLNVLVVGMISVVSMSIILVSIILLRSGTVDTCEVRYQVKPAVHRDRPCAYPFTLVDSN